jgi:hypothetical protein
MQHLVTAQGGLALVIPQSPSLGFVNTLLLCEVSPVTGWVMGTQDLCSISATSGDLQLF